MNILPLLVVVAGVAIAKLFKRFQTGNLTRRSRLVAAVAGLLKYPSISCGIVDRRRNLFLRMSKDHQNTAIETMKRYKQARQCAQANSIIINDIAQEAIKRHNITAFEIAKVTPMSSYQTLETFNHLIRDFCDLTEVQRRQLFEPILSRLPSTGRACLPGSGVGGLALEMAGMGWSVDAMELDPALHIAAEYAQTCAKTYSVFPWCLEFSHLEKGEHQSQVGILNFKANPHVHFLYENFLTYEPPELYDCVVTLFFIDTAENVLDYFDKIYKILKPGGTWINYGPLKWGSAPKVELALDEMMSILSKHWKVTHEWEGTNRYSGAPQSMWKAHYGIKGWSATKSR